MALVKYGLFFVSMKLAERLLDYFQMSGVFFHSVFSKVVEAVFRMVEALLWN